jgi:hypothetical protein
MPGSDVDRRVDVNIDPAAFDECLWGDEDGLPHRVVAAALDCAFEDGDEGRYEDGIAVESKDFGASSPTPESTEPKGTFSEVPVQTQQSTNDTPASLGAGVVVDPLGATRASIKTSKIPRIRLSAKELEGRYSQILASLEEFHVKALRPKNDEPPYVEGPAFVEYAVTPAYGVSVSKIESQLDNLKLRLKLASDAQIGCTTHLGNVLLSAPKSDSDRYFVDASAMWDAWSRPSEGFAIPLGEDIRGETVDIDFASSNSPHVLIAGVTGSGKSEALLTILHGATRFYSPEELQLALIDPKRTELVSLEDKPHKMGEIGATPEDAIELLSRAVDEMERRYIEFRSGAVRDIHEYQRRVGPMPRWLIVLDEYADLTSDDAERKEVEKYLKRLAQKARAAGIHLIVSTQKPVVAVVNTVVKGNLPGRIALRVSTGMESKVILDEGGAEQLVGKGDALLKIGARRVRLQFARFEGLA